MAIIQRIPIAPNLDFLGKRKFFMVFSAALLLSAVALFLTVGLNLGIDFRGGVLIEVETEGPANIPELRRSLGGLGLGEIQVQEFGAPNDILIRVQQQEGGEDAQQSRCRAFMAPGAATSA